ncbi:patatin-like phospholipase family protein [Hoyosella altamirensis]|uniref:Putative acylesterase/phospholipase RssA n=1 Tax=Hoyosella altamirensis TaxID=616997 RepID=A0A839RK50_9ACTN|nr:patatin-like phospholipase family protein [Hoyosella altamirensis]MBB3037222.1 putative acylesterase/phospholipase RssA [Hoyosella altamirensis]
MGSDSDSWNARKAPVTTLRTLLMPGAGPAGPPAEGPPLGYLDTSTYDIPLPESGAASTQDAWNDLLNRSRRQMSHDGVSYEAYCRASADITMKGGTTSGIVYPLAVCEVARSFRLRNVGGASAGAIAAAAAAAAELGRIRMSARLPLDPPDDGPAPGFAGLASIPQWLTQLEPEAPEREKHRLAELFTPSSKSAGDTRAFRVIAFWLSRGSRIRQLPSLLRGVGIPPVAVLFAALAVLFGALALESAGTVSGLVAPWWALALSVFAAVAGTILVAGGSASAAATLVAWWRQGRAAARTRPWSGENREYWALRASGAPREPLPVRAVFVAVLWLLAGLASWGVVAAALAVDDNVDVTLTLAVLAATVVAVGLVVALVVCVAALRVYRTFRSERHFGVLTGDTLVQWIDLQMRGLAGQKSAVTFGDLWRGARDASPALTEQLTRDPFERTVNLKLMVTDLSQQRPFQFPLPPQQQLEKSIGSKIYVCPDDLRAIFGDGLTDAIAPPHGGGGLYYCWDDASGGYEPLELRPLAEPWDLPVVFAVRASMSLPFLFRAVRTFRVRPPTTVRDNFGIPIPADGAAYTSPTPPRNPQAGNPQTDTHPWLLAEELWLSDGGITSNFPVHLFDRQLPEWPTFGLNLGSHPLGYEHQDVWLPEDWQANVPRWVRVGTTPGSFLSAILDTARGWRDVMQTHMPSARGRVAWVWLRRDEGGTNLFMRKETVASLCMRGALAGMRLRTRFEGDSDRWHRHRWLRLRATVHALDELSDDVTIALPQYRDLLDPVGASRAARIDTVEAPPPTFLPGNDFWPAARDLLDGVAAPRAADADLRRNTPHPAPELRQVPRV